GLGEVAVRGEDGAVHRRVDGAVGPGQGERRDRRLEGGGGVGVGGRAVEAENIGLDHHSQRVHLVHLQLRLVPPGGGVGEQRLRLAAFGGGAAHEPALGAHHPAHRHRAVEQVAEAVGGDEVGDEALPAGDVPLPHLAGEEVVVLAPAPHHLLVAGGVAGHLVAERGDAAPEGGELGSGRGQVGLAGGEHVVDLAGALLGGTEVGAGIGAGG